MPMPPMTINPAKRPRRFLMRSRQLDHVAQSMLRIHGFGKDDRDVPRRMAS